MDNNVTPDPEVAEPVSTPVEETITEEELAPVAEAPETPVAETPIVEAPAAPVCKKKSCKHVPIIVILLILFLGAAGFGVFEFLQNSEKERKIADLRTEIAQKENVIIEYKTYEPTTTKDTSETKTEEKTEIKEETKPTTTTTTVKSENGYIYVGEWGIKIKVPDDLAITGYLYTNGILYVTGTTMDGHQYLPEFSDITKNTGGLGAIAKYSAEEYDAMPAGMKGTTVLKDGNDIYAFTTPQAVYSKDEDEISWEKNSAAIVKIMLTQNVSKF